MFLEKEYEKGMPPIKTAKTALVINSKALVEYR
jgi:hypothetical protein